MLFKDKLKTLILGYKATSNSYILHLKKIGCSIGDDVVLFRPYNTTIDTQNPHLLSIGSHVMITGPTTILTHDYSWSVLKRKYGVILGNQKQTIIGNNVFIGWRATICAGTEVGDNVIIGANSVVTGKIESDSVYAGNPAKKIMTLEEFYRKRQSRQVEEAVSFVHLYKEKYGKFPKEEQLDEYFFLFSNGEKMTDRFKYQMKLLNNEDECLKNIRNPVFDGYSDFLEYCNKSK